MSARCCLAVVAVVLIWDSLRISAGSLCLLGIQVSSEGKVCFTSFAHFLIRWLVFCFLVLGVLSMFWISLFYQKYDLWVFSAVLQVVLYSVDSAF